ncbi:MAG: hypothetical protein JO095_08900 [Alphaproteobacteria bacterium]|nr:hypothetical protein [Alphaproteobacteria bacterium]
MTVSILTFDDEADIAELFRQHFRREVRQGLCALHFADSAEEALQMLADGIRPQLIVILSDISSRDGRAQPVARGREIAAGDAGHDGHRQIRSDASKPRSAPRAQPDRKSGGRAAVHYAGSPAQTATAASHACGDTRLPPQTRRDDELRSI